MRIDWAAAIVAGRDRLLSRRHLLFAGMGAVPDLRGGSDAVAVTGFTGMPRDG